MADFTDPLEAAKRRMLQQRNGQSFFPAANLNQFSDRTDINDMLGQQPETGFIQPGNPRPRPSPTPTPVPRSYFSGGFQPPQTSSIPNQFGFNQPQRSILGRPPQLDQWQSLYGWSNA